MQPSRALADEHVLAEQLATACRVMAMTGLVEGILGHISARLGDDRFLMRCRGPVESGLAYTTGDDVHALSLTEQLSTGAWAPPNELPIHAEILRARPEVTAVVHAHPPAVVTLSIAGLPLEPVVGAYDITAARLAADGIPVWPRAALVNTAELGRELAGCLGDRPVAVLAGHGLVSVASGPPEEAIARAVVQAISVETLARLTLQARAAGGVPAPISAADLDQLPDLGPSFTVETQWRYLCHRLVQSAHRCTG